MSNRIRITDPNEWQCMAQGCKERAGYFLEGVFDDNSTALLTAENGRKLRACTLHIGGALQRVTQIEGCPPRVRAVPRYDPAMTPLPEDATDAPDTETPSATTPDDPRGPVLDEPVIFDGEGEEDTGHVLADADPDMDDLDPVEVTDPSDPSHVEAAAGVAPASDTDPHADHPEG